MEPTEITKILFGLVTASGTIGLTLFNLRQRSKITAELLEKFDNAVEKKQKHSACELFRLIHGVRMSYSDIVELIENDESSKIIFALKKTPGLVCYKDGSFQYTGLGKSSIFKFIDKWLNKFGIIFFSILTSLFFLMLVLGKSAISIIGLIFMVVCSYLLAEQIRQNRYNQMVENLVIAKNNKT